MAQPVLASEFAAASRADWLRRVEAVLKGESFQKRLTGATSDGITVDAIYEQAAGPSAHRAVHAPWTVVQRLDYPDAARANAQALDDLENGANGLALVFQGSVSGRGFGLTQHDATMIGRALKDVRLDLIALRLEPGPHGRRTAEAFAQWIADEPYDPERLDVSFGMDPIGGLAGRGDLAAPWGEVTRRIAAAVAALRGQHFRGPFAVADGRVWHDGGATEAQELAYALATAVAYLRALDVLDDEALGGAVGVTLAADQDMFPTLAKFRAMRLLWNQILSACGLPTTPLKLHAETSWRMITRRDPYSNILRTAAAVFAAGLGGADSIAVLPFSIAQGLPDGFARRVARNTQTLLLQESNLWRVADPASGSGYVEHLTRELAGKAWDLFQSIERAGGIVASLQSGTVQASIAQSRARRAELKETIIGTTDFLVSNEPLPSIETDAPAQARKKDDAAVTIDAIPAWRLAEDIL
jgi:methylmalonyl-CoA mutase